MMGVHCLTYVCKLVGVDLETSNLDDRVSLPSCIFWCVLRGALSEFICLCSGNTFLNTGSTYMYMLMHKGQEHIAGLYMVMNKRVDVNTEQDHLMIWVMIPISINNTRMFLDLLWS